VKVLVIPEDPKHDQFMLKPLIEAALAFAGRANPHVRVCSHRLIGGDATVINYDNLCEIIDDNLDYDVFLLSVDRDCRDGRRAALDALETRIRVRFNDKRFIAQCAQEEIEVWVLAGIKDIPKSWTWRSIREHCHPKENYFDKYAKLQNLLDTPGFGRQVLGREAAARYRNRIRTKCPEIRVFETTL
jgi:hypothetical protein